jgi:hypothetical protein
MKIQTLLLLPIILFGAHALPAQVLLNDNFTSGTTGTFLTAGNPGIGVQNAPASAEWFSHGSFVSNGIVTYTNGVGITDFGVSAGNGVSAYFKSLGNYATLSVGQTLTLSVNFNFSAATAQPADLASQFRMGLFNSGSTGSVSRQATADTGNVTSTTSVFSPTNYSGYYAEFNPNDAGGGIDNSSVLYYRPVGGSTNWIGTNAYLTQVGPNQTNAASLAGWATDNYQAVLTMDYTSATTMTNSFDIFDLSTGDSEVGGYAITGTTTNLVTSFDGLTLGGGNGGVGSDPITFTNVDVSIIPEPSAYAAIFGVAALGFAAYRRRRQCRNRKTES